MFKEEREGKRGGRRKERREKEREEGEQVEGKSTNWSSTKRVMSVKRRKFRWERNISSTLKTLHHRFFDPEKKERERRREREK